MKGNSIIFRYLDSIKDDSATKLNVTHSILFHHLPSFFFTSNLGTMGWNQKLTFCKIIKLLFYPYPNISFTALFSLEVFSKLQQESYAANTIAAPHQLLTLTLYSRCAACRSRKWMQEQNSYCMCCLGIFKAYLKPRWERCKSGKNFLCLIFEGAAGEVWLVRRGVKAIKI